MADGVTIDMDVDATVLVMKVLGDVAQPYVNAAAQVSADRIQNEAQARLRRQLSSKATGKTVASIVTRPAFDGNGIIVIAERDPYPELPLWLEKGTKPGGRPNKARTYPRPFFYVSAELEEGPHFRRIQGALQDCITDQGLGE
jgi:hypothetical protein